MIKCKQCGGTCKDIGGGNYMCQFCGTVLSEVEANIVKSQVILKSDNGADVFEKNINGILEISCSGKKYAWAGSGYLISNDGFAITNAHVAADDVDGKPCKKIVVKICNQNVSASVVALADDKAGRGNGIDLALIKLVHVPKTAVALKFADSDTIRNGEPVFVIGNPLGEGTCITSGIVSDKARRIGGQTFIMTDCAVNGGNSGGPIFNRDGLVIGTITLQGRTRNGADAEGMNYAIPGNAVQQFIFKAKQKIK